MYECKERDLRTARRHLSTSNDFVRVGPVWPAKNDGVDHYYDIVETRRRDNVEKRNTITVCLL